MAENESKSETKDPRPLGYPLFAFRIAEDKDKFTTIYRRFERLAARNLLYFEAELCELEATQDRLDKEAEKANYISLNISTMDDLRVLARQDCNNPPSNIPETTQTHDPINLPMSNRAREEGEDVDSESSAALKSLNVAIDIRRTLKEYYEALKLESDILALHKPARQALECLRNDFDCVKKTRRRPVSMIGDEMKNHLHADDLCVLAPQVERDRLTKFFEGPFSQWSDIFRERDSKGKTTDFVSGNKISNAVGFISIIAATAFLVAAIWALYAVPHPKYQLIMLTFFAICFAACIALLTNARRQDVFGVTAGYVAVLVVFISTNMASVWPPPPGIALDLTILASSTINGTTFEPSVVATASVPTSNYSSSATTSDFIGAGITAFFALLSVIIIAIVWIFRYISRHRGKKSSYIGHLTQPSDASATNLQNPASSQV